MKHYTVGWYKKATKSFEKIPSKEQDKILKLVEALQTMSPHLDIKKLQGYSSIYRMRSGDYRIIFSIDAETQSITIWLIGHRQNIYEIAKKISMQ